jgi:hypothetical protein
LCKTRKKNWWDVKFAQLWSVQREIDDGDKNVRDGFHQKIYRKPWEALNRVGAGACMLVDAVPVPVPVQGSVPVRQSAE